MEPLKIFMLICLSSTVLALSIYHFLQLNRQLDVLPSISTPINTNTSRSPKTFVLMVDTRIPSDIDPIAFKYHTQRHPQSERHKYFKYYTITSSIANSYCSQHNYEFIYYIPKCNKRKWFAKGESYIQCIGYKRTFGSIPVQWMKIKGILHLLDTRMSYGDLALYIDTDYVFNMSVSISDFIASNINIDNQRLKHVALCWDAASFWTTVARDHYKYPINSGVILFYKTVTVEFIMRKWWQSVQVITPLDQTPRIDPETNKSRYINHALEWPYEQDALSYIVSTAIFKDDIVLFKESYVVKTAIGWHLALYPGHKRMSFIVNASKWTFIPQCEHAEYILADDVLELNHCDKDVNEKELIQTIHKWTQHMQLSYIDLNEYV